MLGYFKLAGLVKIRIMKWGGYPAVYRQTLCALTSVFIRWKQREISDRRGEVNVTMEAETGVKWP